MTKGRALLLAALAVSVALLVFAITWSPGPPEPAGPDTGLKIIVVGVDGLDWYVVGELLQQNAIPNLGGLMQRGRTGEVAADMPALPSTGWTLLARGRDLTRQERSRLEEEPGVPLRGRVPELARVVESAGGKVVTVGWPATWPADDSAGIVAAPYSPETLSHPFSLPPALLGDGAGQSSTPALAERVGEAVARNRASCEAEFRRYIFDGDAADEQWEEQLLAARWAFLSDLVTADVAASTIAEEEPDVALVCLNGLDAIGHRFVAPAMPDFFPGMPDEYARYSDILENYYRFIDHVIERMRRLTDEQTIFIVCSVYGTHPWFDAPPLSGAHTQGPPGVFVVRGPEISHRSEPVTLSTLDLVPTALAILGMQIPSDLDGRVMTEILPKGLTQHHPLTFGGNTEITTVEPTQQELTDCAALVQERLDFLRSQMSD